MRGLRNKRVWVSGASGALGSRLVETFLALGCEVIASARRRTRLLDLRASLHNHERLRVAENDASDPHGVEALLDDMWRKGPLDAAIQCAGAFSCGPLSNVSDAEGEQLLRANFLAHAWLLRGCLRRMAAHGAGHIILVAADRALEPAVDFGFYGASKAATAHLAQVGAAEGRASGVKVCALLPGTLDTAANRAAGIDPAATPMLSLTKVCEDVVTLLTADTRFEQGPLIRLPLGGSVP